MARTRGKRNTKPNAPDSPEPTTAEEATATPPESGETTDSQPVAPQEEDKCPACTAESTQEDWNAADKESWVRCDACKKWFHWRCAGEGDLESVGKWCVFVLPTVWAGVDRCAHRFCQPCRDADPKRVITMKPPARKSSRKRTQRDYAGLNAGNEQDPDRYVRATLCAL